MITKKENEILMSLWFHAIPKCEKHIRYYQTRDADYVIQESTGVQHSIHRTNSHTLRDLIADLEAEN